MSINPASDGPVHLLEVSTTGALPRPLSSFVGRHNEIAEIETMLRNGAVRLLTLVGPGGVGKTRLGVESAARVADTFPDGVWFVDLAPLTDPALVIPTVARTIGLQESPNKPVALHLRDYLRNRRTLLLLDNLEQVIAAASDLADLISNCPELVIFATSREPLAVGGEQEYPVQPLATDPDAEAVRLFAERARAILPGFALTAEIESLLAEICRRLDGLPLAIELAAARVKTLPPHELLARLDRRLPVLTGVRRDAPHRQQTMRDTIAWSYELLSPDEQAQFRRLSVWVGGFTLELAEAQGSVARRGESVDPLAADVLDTIASLVDKNLLRQQETVSDEARYAMLQTVREYGLEQLAAHNELADVQAAHADALTAYVERLSDRGSSSMPAGSASRLITEADNVRAALAWAIETDEIELGLRLATAYFWTWHAGSNFTENRQWFMRLRTAATETTPKPLLATAIRMHSWSAHLQGDLELARQEYGELLALPDEPEYAGERAFGLYGCGLMAMEAGDFDRAEALIAEAVALARLHEGDPFLVAGALEGRALLAFYRGDHATAERIQREELAQSRARGDEWDIVANLGNLAGTLRKQGKIEAAASFNREELAISRKLAMQFGLSDCCLQAAEGSLALGRPKRAARLAGAAAKLRDDVGFWGDSGFQRECAAIEAGIRAAQSPESFEHEWAAGRAMSLDDFVAEADTVFAEEESTPDRAATQPAADAAVEAGLTPRETEVLRLIAQDWSNQQIADALFLSRRTVHKHVENILAKLGTDSRAGAAVWAVRHDLE